MTSNTAPQPISIVRDSRAAQISQLVLIFVAGLFIYGWKVGVPPIAGTEPLRALVAHQMVQSGELLIPRLYGELYLRKPPLQYWVVAATEKAFGFGNEFVWRLPSVVASAFLAAFLAWWAARWFGDPARLVTGFSCLALVALWAQDRGGDIDALDTMTATLGACCILEIAFAPAHRPWIWTILLGVCSAAILLLKGPAGLPPSLAALAACAFIGSGRTFLRKPWIWIGLAFGLIAFAAYTMAVYSRIQSQHLAMDFSGAEEARQRILLRSLPAIGWALLVPLQVLIYALPVSVGLPAGVYLADKTPQRDRVRAIAVTILGSLMIGIIAGTTNPRYSYICMPLLAPLVGAVAAIVVESKNILILRLALLMLSPLWFVAQAVLTVLALKKYGKIDLREHVSAPRGFLLVILAVAGIVAVWGARGSTIRRHAWSVAIMIVLLGIPFAEMKNAERTQFSGRAAGTELRKSLGGPIEVSTAAVNRDMPQIFYYADIPVHAFGERKLADLAQAAGGRWVFLNQDEFDALPGIAGGSLSRVTQFRMPNDTDYLAWYDH